MLRALHCSTVTVSLLLFLLPIGNISHAAEMTAQPSVRVQQQAEPPNDTVQTISRELGHFDALALLTAANVRYTVAAQPRIKVTGPASALQTLNIQVGEAPGGANIPRTLSIDATQTNLAPHQVSIEVAGPDLQLVYLGGSGDIRLQGLHSPQLQLILRGTGNIRAQGRTDNVQAELAGSGNLYLGDLHAREAQVKLLGTGNISVFAAQKISVELSGKGNVQIRGQPAQRNLNAKGIGHIAFD